MNIENVSFSYSSKSKTLQQINATVEKGKITTIIGPNGSGKSTLLDVMSRHAIPNSGQIVLEGKSLQQFKPKQLAQQLAVVHQHNAAPADLTVEKLVSYGRIPYKQFLTNETSADHEAVEEALVRTNLIEKRKKRIAALSGGEKQRVWIAVALAQSTPYLFLDEPTTYLDLFYQYEILELVKSLNKQYQLTVVMVLHDMNQAVKYSDCVIAMKNGQVVVAGEPEQVINAETVKYIYGVDVIVRKDPEIGLYMVPVGLSGVTT
ncbi:ABC transporter ATP-binding protein [Paenibacillus yanchengensis]|uniref:ABC transporter ATP-binding protein n=1 Tax=Paenibacillus yanchengensis TaxID=2035833 RepID=A0ABW4YPM1_9BACL